LIPVTSTIPMSRGELLPLHHGAEGDDVDVVEGQPGVASRASPLLSSQSSCPYGVFCDSLSPCWKIAKEGYI
jgi:hypothetical protein